MIYVFAALLAIVDIVQEMMGAEADLAEYSLKSVSAFHNDQSINNYPLSPGASASFNQLSKPPVTGKYASPSGPSPGFDFNYIVKKAPKSDLLQDLIAAREQSLAKVPSMNSLLQRGSGSGEELLVTQREGIVLKVTISERDDCLLSMLPPTDEGESSELSGPTKYMSCTLEDESRMYIKRRSAVEGYSSGGGGGGSDGGNLLGTSIEALLEESHAKQVNARLQLEHAERGDAEGRGLDYATSIASVAATGQEAGAGAGTDSLASSLWVEKYAPKAFSQLLSLERTNRDVLKALKAWDAYVFNKPVPKSKGKNDLYAAGPAGSGGSSKYKSGGGDDDGDSDSDNEADSDPADLGSQSKSVDLRPQQRVILLSGPPGSGKTTLAHVIARHCGYNVIEVNASDDRSSAVLKDKIQRSIQSNTISLAPTAAGGASIGGVAAGATKPSPNCLILDEIDGIDSRETVDMLCKIIKAPLPNQKDQGSKDTALTRPLICVCNDQYAPALRELRKHCQIFTFTTPLVGRLVQRLKRILSLEGVDLPPSVLSMLCAANGNDIRSCLNTLQFATLQCKEAVDLDHLAGAGGRKLQGMQLVSHTLNQMVLHGLKDEQKSAFQIWKVLFNNRDAAALLGGGSAHSASSGSAAPAVPTAPARVVRDKAAADGQLGRMLMSIVDEFDDMELLVGGLHENLLAINYNDPCLTKTSSAFDWLSYADIMAPGYGGHSPFTSAACVAIHMMCAVDHRTQVSWPQKDREMHFKKQEVQSMLQSLVDNRFAGPGGARAEPKREGSDFDCDSDSDSCSGSTHTSVYASRQAIAVDTISFLVSLVHPKVRAHISSVSSLSMVERHILHGKQCIALHCSAHLFSLFYFVIFCFVCSLDFQRLPRYWLLAGCHLSRTPPVRPRTGLAARSVAETTPLSWSQILLS